MDDLVRRFRRTHDPESGKEIQELSRILIALDVQEDARQRSCRPTSTQAERGYLADRTQ
jgi:hypothetical protein